MKRRNGACYCLIGGALLMGLSASGRDPSAEPSGPVEGQADGVDGSVDTGAFDPAFEAFQADRLRWHPRAQAALRRVEAALADSQATAGYFDTQAVVSGGHATWHRPVPGFSHAYGPGADATGLQAGVEQAFRPGFFVASGVADRVVRPSGSEHSRVRQSLAVARIRVPAMRNRGHAQWRFTEGAARFRLEAARRDLGNVIAQLRFESGAAYIQLLQATADAAVIRRAEDRVQILLRQTETLVGLNTVPEYQIFPSRLDAVLREEEAIMAEQRVDEARVRLETLLGPLPAEWAFPDSRMLSRYAERALRSDWPEAYDHPIEGHGEIVAIESRIAAARMLEAAARDAARPDLAIALSATWQGERGGAGDFAHLPDEDRRTGYEAALLFQVPLQRRAERAAIRGEAARVAALEADLRFVLQRLRAQVADSTLATRNARRRLQLVNDAVENARLTLAAESERFRLGESRSRDVLDAQKDLAAAELRRNAAAGALLQAEAALTYAIGYHERHEMEAMDAFFE